MTKPRTIKLTYEEAAGRYAYDPLTGKIFHHPPEPHRHQGRQAGTIRGDGYRDITYQMRQYKAHRIAWLLTYGAWPEKFLDHINGNRDDNRIANLRECTPAQSNGNVRVSASRNKSGFRGVSWYAPYKKWKAALAGKHLGYFDSPEDASRVYDTAAKERWGEFYSSNRVGGAVV